VAGPNRPIKNFADTNNPVTSVPAKTKPRFVTITFDDGLIKGARKAMHILGEFEQHATFYVVTGWVRPRRIPWVRDQLNKGRDHGSWNDWRNIQNQGHEIGSHTVTHLNAGGRLARWCPQLLRWELARSQWDLGLHLGKLAASISMPWNSLPNRAEPYVRRIYSACRLGSQAPQYNALSKINWHRLESWAPDSDVSSDDILDCIHKTPEGHWIILQFHSLDDEGYMPISSEKFRKIVSAIATGNDIEHITVRKMVERFKMVSLREQPVPGRKHWLGRPENGDL
jgi:hypothetical protein